MSSCPNITSPKWKALINKIGENNAWREFLANGYIPSVDNYDVIENVSTLKEQKTKPGLEELFDSNPELANAVYEAAGFTEKTDYKKEKDIFYQDVKSKYNFESTNSLLNSISNNTKNPNYKRLADTFLKIKELKEVKLIENNNLSVNGTYSLSTNSININVDRILKRSNIKGYNAEFMLEQTILHEIVHALTKKATASLERNEFIRNIENLAYKLYSEEIKDSKSDFKKYLEIQQEIKSNKENVSEEDYEFVADRQFKFYGLTNLDEFLTMSMTNPDFRNKLKETTLWQELKYIIAKFLGIVKTDLDFLENNFDKFLESTYSVNLEAQITPQQKQQALQQYSQYLDQIFPDSKVKDVVYRGGNLGTKQPQDVEAFTTNKSYAEYRAEQNNTQVYPAILNIQESKLLDKKETRTLSLDRDDFQYQDYGFTDNKDQTKQLGNFYTVKENNRHILGSKQDIEGFKEFVGDETNVTEKKDVLYSIRTKSLEQIAKGLNTDLIRSEQQIKYSGYVKSMVLNLLGDIGPGKKMKMSPTQAFQEAKQKFIEINNNIALTLNSYIESEEDLQTIKNSESYSEMLEFLPTLEYINTYEDLVKAASVYKNVVDDFNSYVDFVKIDLAHNGIRITKGKIENIDIKEKTINEEDETSDDGGGISQNEIGQKYGQDSFEVNPRDTASIRVKALIQTIAIPGEFEFGVPIYASPNDVFADMLEIGSDINLSGYKSNKTKLQKFKEQLSQRGESRPYLKNLLEKIINYENNNQWDNINDILTVSSKSYAIETLLLYKLKRVGSDVFGISDVKIISTNRDTVDKQISKEWLFQNVQSDFYRKDSFGDIFPKQEKINQLTKIIEEGLNKDRTVQIQKFQEFFDVLGIKFSDTEAKSIAEKLPKLLKKSDFNQFFVKKNLLNNIVDSFQTHIKEPFTGQYGFENENTSMKKIAQIYYLENPGKYKITSTKTADGKSKYSYIFPTYLEQIKREWSNGKTSSITNGVLSKPNSKKQTSFWQKVISGNAKFDLQYFNGVREQKAGQKGDVRKTLTPKEQIVSMFLKHQQNLNVGSYIAFTLSDKTTTMETSMTKEFFVDEDANPVGFNSDYTIENGGIVYTTALKKKIYNSFVEPEISRILASIKNKKSTNIENHEIASKLFYFFPNLNRNTNLIDFRNDLYSGEFTIEEIAAKYGDVVSQAVLNEMIMASEKQVDDLISMNVIAVDDSNNYTFPTFINGYKENDYVNRFRKVSTTGKNMARLMVMDMKLNYLNSQIKTIQFLKFDPALAFKTSIDVKDKSISDIDVNDRVEIANSTWDEFSKRAASLIAPGSQGSWFWNLPNGEEYNEAGKDYLTVTGKDIKKEIKNTDGSKLNKSETTDAQEYVTMQEHIDYLMSEGKMDIDTWYSIYKKIKDAGPGGYYTLTSEELGIAFSPIKPVHVNSVTVGDPESGLNRIDYIKSSRYPLIPQHEAGSERDKLRIWMEKNNVRSVNFGSGKKIGRPTKSLTLFDENDDFIEPSSEDFELSKQFLSRDGLRNQQEIPDQKDKIRTVSQMNRTLFDGLLEVDDFQFGNMKDVSGATGKTLKEAVRSKLFDIETAKLTEKLGNNLNRDHRKLYELIKDVIVNDTTGSYTENDLNSLKINPETNQFEIPLEGLWKLTKFQSLINSLINKNVMLKVDGSSFIQVSGAGAKFSFSKISKGVKSDIIWLDKHAKQFAEDGATLKYMRQVDGKTKAAQVIVSQYLRDEEGNLINLANYIKEDKYGRKILDTSTFDEKMFQLIGTRIPNQSHPSTLPIEVVGFLPSYMENAMVVPDGITGQMGSDFDVDKLYTYFSKFKYKEKSTTEKLGANQEEYDELIESAKKIAKAAGEKADKKGIFKNFNTYLSQAVKEKYGDAEVPKFKIEKPASIEQVTYDLNSIEDVSNFNEDQLKQLYRDIHWEVLMNPATFSKITSSVDLPEVKSKVDIRNEQLKKYKLDEDVKVNLPLDFTTSINRYIDNRSGKTGVSIFATLISAQADFQDKIINLSFDGTPNPLQIKLSKNSKVINLEFIGKLGKSKSFLYEPGKIEERSISDNLNIMFTESVDNAKNQFLREFNWSDKAMSSVGLLAMLSDSNGDSAPIEIMMDLTSQPAIFELFKLIEQKQDSFGQYEADAILTSAKELQNGIIKKIDNEGYLPTGSTAQSYFEDKTRNDVIDAESLSESWIIGKAVMQKASKETLEQIAKDFKYDSLNDMMLNYYNTQYNSIDTYIRLEDLGRELMTILGAIYPYTKGIGANVFSTKQRTNQLNKLQYSSNFSGLENIAGEITKLDNGDIQLAEPVGEIGSNIKNSLLFAQDLYKSLFPISSGEELESIVDNIVTFMGLDKLNLSKDKYETYYSTVFDSIVSYMKTNPSFELFKNVIEERNRLINGESSIGYRVLELKKDSKYSKNGFLKNIEVEKDYKSDTYVISFKAPFGSEIDEKEVSLGFYNLALDENNDIKQLAKDFALYPHATSDAGYLGRYIPVGYYMSDVDYKKAMSDFQNMFNKHITTSGSKAILIDQIVQNNSEVFSKQFSFTTTKAVDGTYSNPFKKVFSKIVKSESLKDVNTFTFKIGDFPDTAKYKSTIKSLKIPLSENELKSIRESSLVNIPAGIDFKYPKYLLIKDQVLSDIPGIRNEDISYLYKRTSSIVTELGDATYERIEILGFKNISEFDFNNPNLVSSIKMNNVSRDEKEQDAANDILNQPTVTTSITSTKEGTSNPVDYTNHSGGAALSDAEWDQIGREFGVVNHKHYREPLEYIDTKGQPAKGSKTVDSKKLQAAGIEPTYINQKDYDEGAKKATQAFRMMFTDAGNKSVRSAYIIRNWMQVKNADAVYALGTIKQPGENASDKAGETRIAAVPIVKGGTGYAVQMAINENKPVYVFDGTKEGWYTYDYKVKNFVTTETPTLTKNFAGIGSRSLSTQEVIDKSLQAIRDVYEKTFKSAQPSTVQTAEQVYPQLSEENVVISNLKTTEGKYNRTANIKEAESNNRIYSMETTSDLSFSNPWASFKRTGTIKTRSTKEAVLNYIDWLTTDKFKDIKPERREWILQKLKSGELKSKPIQYYANLGEPSHATALDYLINKYNWSKPTTPTVSEGIEINSKQTGLGNDLTNVHYATNGKSKFDIKPSDTSLSLTPEAKKTWGESVEAWYKSNNAKSKGIPEGIKGDAYDMKLMVGLITDKLKQYPNLVSEITNRGGMQFLDKSTHNMGTGRWSSKNPKNMFMNALKEAYQNVSTTPTTTTGVKTYQGKIESLKPNQIFVFGSNPQGRHGAGAAKQAKDKFGAVQFIGRGLRNQTYALVTKNLTAGFVEKETGIKYEKAGEKSLTSEQIQSNIKDLYDVAKQNPDKEFVVAYSVDGKKNLNGYTDQDMADMFNAFPIPDNMVFEEGFSKLLSIKTEKTIEEIEEPTEKPEVKVSTVDYKGTNFIIEGTQEEGDLQAFYQAQGEKGKPVTDSSLLNKIIVAHAADIHPERIITLTAIKNQPKYLVGLEGQVISLQDTSYGKVIESKDVIQRVSNIYKNETLTPIQDEPKASNPETTKYIPIYVDIEGKKIETFKWDNDKKIAITLNNDQIKAVKAIVNHFKNDPKTPFILKGKAGTGKTTVIRVINEYLKQSSVIITPTHKAGKNASMVTYGSTQNDYKTFASAYYGNRGVPKEDVFIFDEISMLSDSDLILALNKTPDNKKVIFMGDQRQLPPIKGKKISPFFNSKTSDNVYELKEVMRFDEQGSIFKIANQYAENLKNYEVIKQFPKELISEKDSVYAVDSSKRLVNAYMYYYKLEGNDPSKVRLITYGNKTAELYNNEIRSIIYKGDVEYGIVKNNDLLVGNMGWSIKQVLTNPMVNSSEYIVSENPEIITRTYEKIKFEGQNVTYKEIVGGKFDKDATRTITIIDPSIPANKEIYNNIACAIINMKNLPANLKYESIENNYLDSIEKSGIYSMTTMYAKPTFKSGKATSVELYTLDQLLSLIKKENPKLSDNEIMDMIDNDKIKEYYKIEPNVSFGYAITTHKSQGSTYKHVMVDEYNMSFKDDTRLVDDNNNEFYAYEANQMRYVAFSRPTTTLVIYTKKSIGDDLVYNTDNKVIKRKDQPIDFKGDLFAQIMQSDQNNLITDIFGKDKNANAKTILNSLYKSNISPFYKQVLDLVSKTGGIGNLKIIVDETMTDPGSYNRYEQTIRINPKLAFESDADNINALYDVIIHELFHHVTANIIEMDKSKLTPDQRKWVMSLENLFKFAQEKILNDPAHADNLKNAIAQVNKEGGFLSAKDKSFYYGLTNIHDFVSMLMSDEKFRDFMNNTSYSGEKTLMERFIDIFVNILKALGISVKEDSVLKEGIKNVIGIVESRNQNDAQTDQTLKSIKTKSFLDGIIESEFDKIINYLDIKTKCK